MTHHIFFSWQSDTPNGVGRSLIETCLERAIGTLQADADIDLADRDIAIDRDTLDVPGSPPIMETIFGKIDRAAAFLSDLTYVAERSGGGRTPNPNVCIEHGWALKALTWRRVIAVMNTAMGHPDKHELPFDVRHTRRPIVFDCPQDADADTRRRAKDALTKQLVIALRAIFGDTATQVGSNEASAEPHPHDVELLAQIHRQLPVTLRRFLHQHSFGTPFLLATVEPIHEMNADWIGAAYEFHDPVLQANFSKLRKIAADFGNLVLERIYAMDNNPNMGWPETDLDVSQGMQPSTVEAVREMNEKATELSGAIDSFDRLARDRVRAAIGLRNRPAVPAGPDPRRAQAEAALGALAFDVHRGLLPEIVTKPRVTLRLAPFGAEEGSRLDPRQVAQMQLRFPPSEDALVETNRDGRQWWSSAPPRRREANMNPETSWRMRLVRPGHLEYQATIGERIDDDPDILVDGLRLEALIVRTLERMGEIAEGLGLGGPALVSIILEAEDVQLAQSRPGGRRIRQPVIILPVAVLQGLASPLAPAIQEQLDILWLTAGWAAGSPSYDGGAWAGYADNRIYDPI